MSLFLFLSLIIFYVCEQKADYQEQKADTHITQTVFMCSVFNAIIYVREMFVRLFTVLTQISPYFIFRGKYVRKFLFKVSNYCFGSLLFLLLLYFLIRTTIWAPLSEHENKIHPMRSNKM